MLQKICAVGIPAMSRNCIVLTFKDLSQRWDNLSWIPIIEFLLRNYQNTFIKFKYFHYAYLFLLILVGKLVRILLDLRLDIPIDILVAFAVIGRLLAVFARSAVTTGPVDISIIGARLRFHVVKAAQVFGLDVEGRAGMSPARVTRFGEFSLQNLVVFVQNLVTLYLYIGR